MKITIDEHSFAHLQTLAARANHSKEIAERDQLALRDAIRCEAARNKVGPYLQFTAGEDEETQTYFIDFTVRKPLEKTTPHASE